MTAKVLRKCPECGKLKLRRLIGTGAGVIFKGSGFYETDYRSDSYQKAAKADKPSTEKTDTKTSDAGKAESKSTKSKAEPKKKASGQDKSPKPKKD